MKNQLSLNEPGYPHIEAQIIGSGCFNGIDLRYQAEVSRHWVTDDVTGQHVELVSTHYQRLPVDPARPVIVLFNGGPLSPSVYLHMLAFGPRYLSVSEDPAQDTVISELKNNPYCPLDVADLVMFDPAGTGYSDTAAGNTLEEGFSVEADARQLVNFIRGWLHHTARWQSPLYLFGESYGTIRAAVAARQMVASPQPFKLQGVMLLGQALNIVETVQRPANILSYVASLPTLAATAWYHGKVIRDGLSLEEFVARASAFAGADYLSALWQGIDLPDDERCRIAAELASLTGVDAQVHLRHNLRLSKTAFRQELLREQGQYLSAIDARYHSKSEQPGADPSMAFFPALYQTHTDYLQGELHLSPSRDYRVSSPVKGLEAWDWHQSTPFSDWPYLNDLNIAMSQQPELQTWIGVGYYDLLTTVGATDQAIAQAHWPRERVHLHRYAGGHMTYTIEENLNNMMNDVRTFLTLEEH